MPPSDFDINDFSHFVGGKQQRKSFFDIKKDHFDRNWDNFREQAQQELTEKARLTNLIKPSDFENFRAKQTTGDKLKDLEYFEIIAPVLNQLIAFLKRDKATIKEVGYFVQGRTLEVTVLQEGFSKQKKHDGGVIVVKNNAQIDFLNVSISKGFHLKGLNNQFIKLDI